MGKKPTANGEKTAEKSENILIGYTKWVLKWIFILCAVMGIGLGSWLGYDKYQNQVIPMIAISCDRDKVLLEAYKKSGGAKNIRTKNYYLVQKKRQKSLPHALYRPAYYNKTITHDMKPDDYWMQHPFSQERTWWNNEERKRHSTYAFDPERYSDDYGKVGLWIVRESLQVIWWTRNEKENEWKSQVMDGCREISLEEFHAESERGLSEVKAKLKF